MTKKDKLIDQYIFQIQQINSSELPEWEKVKLIEDIKEQMQCLD